VKADPDAQRRLLDLQALDTAIAQLQHRRKTLPEAAELDRVARELSKLEDDRVRAEVSVDDIDRDIARLEKDIEQVRTRADRDRSRLEAGSGPSKELEALQHELATLARRQSELEDAELELMEQREQAQGVLDAVLAQLATARAQRDEVERKRDNDLADIDKDLEWKVASRAPLTADLPGDLIGLYEKIRESSGIGAALLRAGRCGGCRLELSGQERARVKGTAADEVVRCEECGRILVRTAESGL
jgi:predicted  nucleic acid-binding Zn-ribbon protein